MVTIQRVSAEANASRLLALFDRNGEDAEHPTAVLAEGQCELWLAEDGEEVVGALLGRRIAISETEAYGGVDSLLVGWKYRRQGIGRRLMEEAEAFYRTTPVNSMRLNINVDNFAARELYESMGYQVTREYIRPRGLLRRHTMEKRIDRGST